jgi:RimJ/RimL family protein N-acetyltransferase
VYASQSHLPDLNAQIGAFVSNICFGGSDQIERYCSMAVLHGDQMVAGTLYHNWHPESGVIELTSASTDRRWLTRPVVRAMFHMAFDMVGAQLAVLRVSERNTDMVEIARRFGFRGVLIPRLRGRDEAEWLFTLPDNVWYDHPINNRKLRRIGVYTDEYEAAHAYIEAKRGIHT